MLKFLVILSLIIPCQLKAEASYYICDANTDCKLPKNITVNLGSLDGVHTSNNIYDTIGRLMIVGEVINCSLIIAPKEDIKSIIHNDLLRLTYLNIDFGNNYLEALVDTHNFVYYKCNNIDFYAIEIIFNLHGEIKYVSLCDNISCNKRLDLYIADNLAIYESNEVINTNKKMTVYHTGLQRGRIVTIK